MSVSLAGWSDVQNLFLTPRRRLLLNDCELIKCHVSAALHLLADNLRVENTSRVTHGVCGVES